MQGRVVFAVRTLFRAVIACALASSVGCALDRKPLQGNGRRQLVVLENQGAPDAGGGIDFGNGGQAGADPKLCPGPQCPANAGRLPTGMCEPTGVFGMRASVDVTWGGRNSALGYITDNGRGRALVDFKLTIDHVNADGTFMANVAPCNTVLPPFFSSILCEVYQPIFPEKIWDNPQMARFTAQGSYDCTAPGCTMRMSPVTAMIGVDLTEPNGFWPLASETASVTCTSGSGAACFLDHDSDTHPGITIEMLSTGTNPPNQVCAAGYPFRSPPLSADPVLIASDTAARAQDLYLGVRVRVSGQGTLSADCSQRVGMGSAQGFDSRAIGCAVPVPPGQACSADQQMFLDQNMPIYYVLSENQVPNAMLDLPDKSVSTGTSFSITRLGDATAAVSCSDVRAAHY